MEINGQYYCRVAWPADKTETPGLAVHSRFEAVPGEWGVTITPAGVNVAYFRSKDVALECAARLGKWSDWGIVARPDDVPPKILGAVKRLVQELGGECKGVSYRSRG